MEENIRKENILVRTFRNVGNAIKRVWTRLGEADVTDDVELPDELKDKPILAEAMLKDTPKNKSKSLYKVSKYEENLETVHKDTKSKNIDDDFNLDL